MFERMGRLMYRRRRWVLGVGAVLVAVAAVWGFGVFGALKPGGFEDPDSESARAAALATEELGRTEADVVVLYRSGEHTVDAPAFAEAVTGTLRALPADEVLSTTSYWSTGSERFVSDDRQTTYAILRVQGDDEEERTESVAAVEDQLGAPGLSTELGGVVPTQDAFSEQVKEDLARAEMIALPVMLVLLVVVFGSVVAATLPLLVGMIGIVGALAALHVLSLVTDVSLFAPNLVTLLGLGLAVDYGLFMVSRFREEMRRTTDVEAALARTMATAGRTVAVSGMIVSVSLAGLMFFPQFFISTMGFGGVAAVAVDMVAALTVLPAMLAVLGPRVDAWPVRPRVRRGRRTDGAGWARLANSVMRRPVAYLAVIVVVLVALGLPFLRINWGSVDARLLPDGTPEREVFEVLDADFPGNAARPIQAVMTLPGPADSPDQQVAVQRYVDSAANLPGVTDARVGGAAGDTVQVNLDYEGQPSSEHARDLVGQVRSLDAPAGAEVSVGGVSAEQRDRLASMGDTLPWTALMVAVAMVVLLFLAFGSVVLPIKAMIMNLLSLTATYGALVWIFQDGHLSGPLGFTATGSIDPSMPILLLAIVFGLSMDYEVFLLSRIREQYDLTGDNTRAVATGVASTGRIITGAALLLLVVVGAFATSGVSFIKLIGVGMIVAVIVDATVVRAMLVPATMRLLGRANWWAPRPLRGLYARYGLREQENTATPEPVRVAR